jgi:6-phospho-beta-glucosidase
LELKKVKEFPSDFLWGSATSSFQAEGAAKEEGKGISVMDLRHNDGSTCNYDVASDQYHRYKEDVALMKELGLKAFRFSISWSRIFPDGVGKANQKGVDYYNNLIDELCAAGIEPVVTIYHFDYPQALVEKYGGWIHRDSIQDFVDYATFLFIQYGDRVKYWLTINEQDHVVHMPYRLGLSADNRVEAEQLGFQANHHMCVGSALVFEQCHKLLPNAEIGPAICFDMIYPASNRPEDVKAWIDAMEIRSYYILDLHCHGEYKPLFKKYLEDRNMFPIIEDGDMELMKRNSPDFIAYNYYASKTVEAYPSSKEHPVGEIEFAKLPIAEPGIYKSIKNRNLKATAWGWEIDPIGIGLAAHLIYNRYKLPLLITENGYSCAEQPDENGEILDDARIEYLQEHLLQINQVINEGVPIMGYCNWSFIDVVSGHDGFRKRYGLVYVNRTDFDLRDLGRIKKKSFYWYQDTIRVNGKNLYNK